MYANLVTFNLAPGKPKQREKLIQKFDPALKATKGFKQVTFLGNDETGQGGALMVWETKEDAEAAFQAMFPQLQQALEGLVKEPPIRAVFEVIEP